MALCAIFVAFLLAGEARGHEDYAWVRDPQIAHGAAEWVMFHPDAGWCCNDEDCKRRAPEFAHETANGWVIPSTGQTFREGDRGLFKSIDADIWACERPDKQIRCLFVPGSGA